MLSIYKYIVSYSKHDFKLNLTSHFKNYLISHMANLVDSIKQSISNVGGNAIRAITSLIQNLEARLDQL